MVRSTLAHHGLGWKRLLLADGPRQTINALTLWAIYIVRRGDEGEWYDVRKYFKNNSLSTSALTVSTFFTVVIFAGSLLLLIVAGVCYVPLLCYIRGNLKVCISTGPTTYHPHRCTLKEYCCHKVDKVNLISGKRMCTSCSTLYFSASGPSLSAGRSSVLQMPRSWQGKRPWEIILT